MCIRKKDNTVRLCKDYKITINQCIKVDTYPLPCPEKVIQKLAGGTRLTTLDLSRTYQQMCLDEKSKGYTTVNTHKGFCVYNSTIWHSLCPCQVSKSHDANNTIDEVGVYIDNLLVTGDTIEQHLQNLDKVLA